MKFGRNLPRNQVPEWSDEYINYKALKKLIKSTAEQTKHGVEADLAEFFFNLDRNLEDVDGFYNKKYGEAARRLKLLSERYYTPSHAQNWSNKDQIEDLIATLLELRGQLRKLQWYGEVNRRGFVKITKKLDKKVESACAQQRYIESRVDPRPFASNVQLNHDMNKINEYLSRLSEIKPLDGRSSSRSSLSLSRPATQQVNISEESKKSLEDAFGSDSSNALVKQLTALEITNSEDNESSQPFLQSLLQHAISSRAKDCIAELLRRIPEFSAEDDINGRNCIHRLVIAVGRARSIQGHHDAGDMTPDEEINSSIAPAEAPVLQSNPYGLKEVESSRLNEGGDDTADLITFLLDRLSATQRPALSERDIFGRIPLHYAAKYGFVSVCETIMTRMLQWEQLDIKAGIDAETWQDLEGNTPLHLSVIGGWRKTTEILLEPFTPHGHVDGVAVSPGQWSKSNLLLSMATKVDFAAIVRLLAKAGADVNYQDSEGETALHTAARFGHIECAKALLEGSQWHKVEIDTPEYTFGWTPLLVACVDGNMEIVEILIEYGAQINRKDSSGWTPQEHAALRGHIEIAQLLAKQLIKPSPVLDAVVDELSGSPNTSSLEDRMSNNKENGNRSPPPVKSFGHRYLTNESMVLVSLGSIDARKNVKPVQLDSIPLAEAHATQLDTALSIVVSANGATGEPTVFDLPVQENVSTEPISFRTKDITKVKLLFDIIPTYSGSNENVVGRGVALLSSIKQVVGSKKMNLQGDLSVPIISAKSLDIIGAVHFNFLIITPFSHPNMSITENQTYWKSLTAPMVIGHRGLGKNMASRKSLQLGENTIQSFIAAANLGASYVEFDVQLTKDHVPVIYHDFLVSETGIDAPVHALTLEQFLNVNDTSTRQSRPASPATTSFQPTTNGDSHSSRRIQRANSLGNPSEHRKASEASDMSERMKHTRDFKLKGFKGNSRGNFIQAPFTTLEEMLRKLPEHIGFNIEMKYPMLFESEEQEMDSFAVELNSFVDTVLKMVYDLGSKRNIIFSSFHPDICLLLSLKQPSIPILFLTDAGASEVGDVRASSLQEAIRFASRWNLLGIVSAAEPLVMCPRLVRVVKESGLVCVSYGTLNNDPKNVKVQVKEGIDAVIVDSVLAVRKGLTSEESEGTPLFNKSGVDDTGMVTVNGVSLTQERGINGPVVV